MSTKYKKFRIVRIFDKWPFRYSVQGLYFDEWICCGATDTFTLAGARREVEKLLSPKAPIVLETYARG